MPPCAASFRSFRRFKFPLLSISCPLTAPSSISENAALIEDGDRLWSEQDTMFEQELARKGVHLLWDISSFTFCIKSPCTTWFTCCCCSVGQSCPTLCDPMDCSTPSFPVFQYLLEFAQIHITSWEIDGETVETVSDFIFWDSKITADADFSHEIKRRLLLGRKVMYAQQWDCWIIRQFYFQFFKESPHCSP